MFRIALVLFKHVLGRPDQLAECPTMYETMEKLRKIPASYMEEEFLVQEVCSFPDSVGVANVVVVVVVVVVECIYEPYVSSHSVAASSAECNRCSPPSSLVCDQLLTICNIVWRLPQGHMLVAARPHFFRQDA